MVTRNTVRHDRAPHAGAVTHGYVPVNGIEMYYEIHGSGQPLLLLHGGPTTIDSTFGLMLPTLAANHQVIAVEQQGHGHTADIDRPMSFEQMADDTAATLQHLEIPPADVFGFSDGGNVGLGLAIRHPERVRRLAIAGTNVALDGLYPEVVEWLKTAGPDDMGRLREAYERVAPRPAEWPVLVRKVMDMSLEFKGWSRDDLRALRIPVLVAVGDADMVRPEHALELFRLLPKAKLAILPDTDHVGLVTQTDGLLPMILRFLNAPLSEDA